MSRTDKDTPWPVRKARNEKVYYWSDSGFRKTRAWYKRHRSKSIRRYKPEATSNGAKFPYSGLKRTWDFE